MYPRQFSLFKTLITTCVLIVFSFVIVQADQRETNDTNYQVPRKFVNHDVQKGATIELNTLDLIPVESDDEVRKHIVKRGENLVNIAAQYGTTSSKLKEINHIQGNVLRVGQELYISDIPGIIHTLKEDTNFLLFAHKYNLPLEDLMTLNYATQEETPLYKDTEVFLPITIEKAYELGLEEKPKPKPVITYKPKKITKSIAKQTPKLQTVTTSVTKKQTINKVKKSKHTIPNCTPNQCIHNNHCYDKPEFAACSPDDPNNARVCVAGYVDTGLSCISQEQYDKKSREHYHGKIVAQRYDNSTKVNNSFYKGNCTYRAAKRRPDIFPYTSATTQSRSFGGNAKDWYYNAQNAGYSVGYTPVPGCVAVFDSSRGNGYGHVAIVKQVDQDTMLIEDMNGPGGYGTITQWRVSKYKGYIGCIY